MDGCTSGGYTADEKAASLYDPETLHDGWNTLENGEEIYFVKTPALGLWKVD